MNFRLLHREFGAEVLDFDPLRSVDDAGIAALRAALDRHQLLLFRALPWLTPDQQIAITGWFGAVIDNGNGACTVLHNDQPAGSLKLPFHSDLSYTRSPIKGISLQAVALPARGSATAYVSGIAAWARLSPARQERLSALTLRHRYVPQAISGWPEFIAEHPVRTLHPRHGTPILYVTEHHADRVLELDEAESDAMIADLLEELYAPTHVYVHDWRPNDLLVWDNLAVQHARPAVADPAAGTRVMQRVAISDVALPALVAFARRAQADREALAASA